MPCSATAAEKTLSVFKLKKANQICIVFNWYLSRSPTQFFHFQLSYFEASCCCFPYNTGIVLIIKINDSYSKPLLKEVLNNLGVCVI